TLERLPAVDRAVLRAGAWELLFGTEDVDSAIVIDQSVLLISELSNEKSVAYVNAVLDRVAGLAEHIRAAERAVSSLDPAPAADVSEPTPDPSEAGSED
ncbi:MAG: transcription antitermination factor NusB, partial [Dietzia sp.]